MIPDKDLEVLQSFNANGSVTLSAYLRLDTPERRESAYPEFMRQMEERLAECGTDPDCRKALEEDVEIVGLYLRINGHSRPQGLAIFSCAAELFWRVYPLSVPLPDHVAVGSKFDVEPLRHLAGEGSPA